MAAIVTGPSVISLLVRSTPAAIVSASAAADVVDASVVFRTCAAVLRGVAVSVTDSVDTSTLASVVTVEAAVVISVSTMTFIGTVCAVLVDALVVAFVVSTSCFSAIAWAFVGSLTSVVTLSMVSVVCIGETMLSVSFSVKTAVEVS